MWTKKTNNGVKPHSLMKGKSSGMYWMAAGVIALLCGHAAGELTFGTPQNLGPAVNSSVIDFYPTISSDGLELYFSSPRSGGYGTSDLWVTIRATTEDDWGKPNNLGPVVNSQYVDGCPSITSDGLSLFFGSNRPGYGDYDLCVTARSEPNKPWGVPVNLGSLVNSQYMDTSLSISADGLSLYFSSTRPGGYGGGDIWVTTRPTTEDPWSAPVNLGTTINTSLSDFSPYITPDGLTLFFVSNRPGYGNNDIWVTTRLTKEDPWGEPVNLGPTLNTSFLEDAPRLSSDGSTLYFVSDRPGGSGGPDLWQVSIKPEAKCGDLNHPYPLSDLNKDCRVDLMDLGIFCSQWLQDNNP